MSTAHRAEETREDIPLKSGTKSTGLFSCSEECLGGSRFINVSFGVLTLVITAALLVQIYYGDYQVVPHGSVATDSLECSKIGTEILKRGGNAVDAVIASALCLAVVSPHTTGLDAEGQILIYNHRSRLIPNVVDFNGINTKSKNLPRLVMGLAYTHQRYGSLPWKQLIEPSAAIAREGFLIPKMLVEALKQVKAENLYGRLEPGQLLKLESLGDTLENLANISEEDLYKYITLSNQPSSTQAIKSTFNDFDVYVPNGPSPGPYLLSNLEQISKHNFTSKDTTKPSYVYRIAEITQEMYINFNLTSRFHQGTSSNIAAVDKDDNYVAAVMGMSSYFGSGEVTPAGYVLDIPYKNKTCSRLPIILTDANLICGRRFIFAANDIAIATQLIAYLVLANENATESVEAPRFHMLSNDTIGIEGSHIPFFSEETLQYLETLTPKPYLVPEPYDSVNIVEKLKDDLMSHSDSRGGGIASRF